MFCFVCRPVYFQVETYPMTDMMRLRSLHDHMKMILIVGRVPVLALKISSLGKGTERTETEIVREIEIEIGIVIANAIATETGTVIGTETIIEIEYEKEVGKGIETEMCTAEREVETGVVIGHQIETGMTVEGMIEIETETK